MSAAGLRRKLPHLSGEASRRFALARAACWAVLMPVAELTPLKFSVPFLVFISLYANFSTDLSTAAGHGARTEAED